MWMKNFQICNLGLEKAKEPDIKLPTFFGRRESKGISEKNIYLCFIDCAKAFDCVDHNNLWKILKKMGLPDHFTCVLRNLCVRQETTIRTAQGKTQWFNTGKGVGQDCILLPCWFKFYAEKSCKMLCLMNHKLELRVPGEIFRTSDMQLIPH